MRCGPAAHTETRGSYIVMQNDGNLVIYNPRRQGAVGDRHAGGFLDLEAVGDVLAGLRA